MNIFASLTAQQLSDVRRTIAGCILATDMADRYEYVAKLGVRADSGFTGWDYAVSDQRELVMKCIVKMADISNAARPWELANEWSNRISVEFFAQGRNF